MLTVHTAGSQQRRTKCRSAHHYHMSALGVTFSSPTELVYLPDFVESRKRPGIKTDEEPTNTSNDILDKLPPNIRNVKWGYQIKPPEQRIRGIKLLLEEGQKLPPFIDTEEITALLQKEGRNAVDVVADYLYALHHYVLSVVEDRYGSALLQHVRIEYVLTVLQYGRSWQNIGPLLLQPALA